MRNFIVFITLAMSVMLFLGAPIDESYRLYKSIWNLGHLFFFAFLTWLVIKHTYLLKLHWLKMLLVSVLFSLLLGGAIEVLQSFIGRYMEWQDLFMDVLGGLAGFLAIQFLMPIEQRVLKRPLVMLLSTGVLLMALYPVFSVIRDDVDMSSDFPLIADFETEDTLLRWNIKHVERFELDSQLHIKGRASALVIFGEGKYPSISLFALISDWSGYKFLNFSVHNDQEEDLDIEVKIYDFRHRGNGSKYSDRFNREYMIKPGWNTLQIKLLDVINAPVNRKMDIYDIAGFSLFVSDLKEPKSIHLDDIYLSK